MNHKSAVFVWLMVGRPTATGREKTFRLPNTYEFNNFVRMTTKLTLKLKKTSVERGKQYAKKKKTSLSKLIERYIDHITEKPGDLKVTPFVKSLLGIIPQPTKSTKEAYRNYLKKKYK
ncbi:MAG: DUF6364 family protein [Cyclobacteriaceae bacterium]|jgi:hypothetical protein